MAFHRQSMQYEVYLTLECTSRQKGLEADTLLIETKGYHNVHCQPEGCA